MSSSYLSVLLSSPSPLMDLIESGDLKLSSRLDEYRVFFDPKKDSRDKVRAYLATHVAEVSTWPALLADESDRRKCAASFLEKYGDEFWGSQRQRRKYLIEANLERMGVCMYPEKVEP